MAGFSKYTALILAATAAAPTMARAQSLDPSIDRIWCYADKNGGRATQKDGASESVIDWLIPAFRKDASGHQVPNNGQNYGARHTYPPNGDRVEFIVTGAGTRNATARMLINGKEVPKSEQEIEKADDKIRALRAVCKEAGQGQVSQPQPPARQGPIQLHPQYN